MSSSAVPYQNPLNILLVEDDDGDAKAILRAFQKARIANKIVRAGIAAVHRLHPHDLGTKELRQIIGKASDA